MVGSSNSTDSDFVNNVGAYYAFYYLIDKNGNIISKNNVGTYDNYDIVFCDASYTDINDIVAFGVTYSDSIYNCNDSNLMAKQIF